MVVHEILQVPLILWFSSIFCVFEFFPTVTVWFWDPSVHNDNNWRNHTQLLQKVQTDAQEENNALRSGGENVYTFFLFCLNETYYTPFYNI